MKLFVKSLAIAFVLTVIYSLIPFTAQCRDISKEVFRFHILANSDSNTDQNLKLKVRDDVLNYTAPMLSKAGNVAKTESVLQENLQNIADYAQNSVYKYGYSYPVSVELTNMHFDTRYYGKVTMPSGDYDALRIKIGEGKGHNWWCVMYPSLCIGASTNYEALKDNTTESEYDLLTGGGCNFGFKILEYFEKFKNLFS